MREWPGSGVGCWCPHPHCRDTVPWGCFEPPHPPPKLFGMPGWHPRTCPDVSTWRGGIWAHALCCWWHRWPGRPRASSQLGPFWRWGWWHRQAGPTAAGDAALHSENLKDGSSYPTESPKEATKPGAMKALVLPHAVCPLCPPEQLHPTPPTPWQVTSPLPVPSGYPLSEKAARPSPSPGSCTKPPTPWRWPSPGGGEGSRGGVGGCHCARSTGLPGARRPTAWGLWGYGASVRRGSAGGQEAALMSARC